MIYLTRNCAAPTAVRFCQTTWYNDYYFWSIIVYNYEIISLIVCTKSIHIQQDYLSCSIRDSHTDNHPPTNPSLKIDTTSHTHLRTQYYRSLLPEQQPPTTTNATSYYVHQRSSSSIDSTSTLTLNSTLAANFLLVPTLLPPTYLVHTYPIVHHQYSFF